jgi:hypothetical protein
LETSLVARPALLVRVIRIVFATLAALATARGSLSAATAGEKGQAGARHDNRYNFHIRLRKTNHRRP